MTKVNKTVGGRRKGMDRAPEVLLAWRKRSVVLTQCTEY